LKDKDYIKELFSEKLSNHEVPVRSDIWSGIQSQIGNTASTTVVVKGISSSLKWMVGVASSVVVIGTAIWISSNRTGDKPEKVQITQNAPNKIEPAEKSKATIVSISSQKENVNTSPNQSIVDQVVASSINEVEESISHQKQIDHLGNSENSVSQPKGEINSSPIITESNSAAGTSANTLSAVNPQEVKLFEDGKIEEFVNVFTPNGDGMNDVFFLSSDNLVDFTIRIFNEKNQLVFQSTDKNFKWYGLDGVGNMVEPGNYAYIIFATDLNGKSVKMFKSLAIK
jgi:gliding motility-associated-like protein